MHYRRFREVAACVPQPSLLLTVYQPLPGCGIRQLFLHHAGHCGRCYRCPKWVNQRLPQLTAFCWTCKEWVHWLPSTFQFSLPGDWCDHGLGHTFLACTGAFDPWETTWCDCVSTKLPLCRWVHWRKKSSSCRVQMYTENFRCVFFFFSQVWVWRLAWPYCRWAVACSFVQPPLAPRRKTMKMMLLPLCRNAYVSLVKVADDFWKLYCLRYTADLLFFLFSTAWNLWDDWTGHQ